MLEDLDTIVDEIICLDDDFNFFYNKKVSQKIASFQLFLLRNQQYVVLN